MRRYYPPEQLISHHLFLELILQERVTDHDSNPLDPIRRRQRVLDLVGLVYIGPITNRHLDSIIYLSSWPQNFSARRNIGCFISGPRLHSKLL